MKYGKHGSRNKFDGRAGSEFAAALSIGDYEKVHFLAMAGGKHENRRAACEAIAGTILRKLGEFPLPKPYAEPVQEDRTLYQALTEAENPRL